MNYKSYKGGSMRDDVSHVLDSLDLKNIHHRVSKTDTFDKKGLFPVRVNKRMHELWHMMFESENEKTTCFIIGRYLLRSDFEFSCEYAKNFSWIRSTNDERSVLFVNNFSSEKIEKIKELWDEFCNGKKPFDVCRYINKYFINSRCRFVCRRKKGYCRIRPSKAYGRNKFNKR